MIFKMFSNNFFILLFISIIGFLITKIIFQNEKVINNLS